MPKIWKMLCLVIVIVGLATPSYAHLFSNTFAEFHMDFGKSKAHFDDVHSAGIWTMTIEHYSTFAYGDNFFFIDFCSARNFEFGTQELGLYLEYAPRFSINKIGNLGTWDAFVTEAFFTAQINYGHGSARLGPQEPQVLHFSIGPVFLFGAAFDLKVPGIQVLQVQFLYRYEFRDDNSFIPNRYDSTTGKVYSNYDESGFQFTLVWAAKLFRIFEPKPAEGQAENQPPSKAGEVWTRGFLDVWDRGAIIDDRATLLTEPQIYIYFTEALAFGTEVEMSYNFNGTTHELRHFHVDPTVFIRWDF